MQSPPKPSKREAVAPPARDPAVPWEEIERAIAGVRFGTVQLIIQDGRVIQIDRTEKIRLTSP